MTKDDSGAELSPMNAIRLLIEHGWIPLRQVSILLGYNTLRGIYARQRGKSAIPTIRIGGIERVYATDILDILKHAPTDKEGEYHALLAVYKTGLRDHERKLNRPRGF